MHVRGTKAAPFRYWREDGTPTGPLAELTASAALPVPVVTDGWPSAFNVWDISFSLDLETLFVATGDGEGNNRRIMMRRWQRGTWQTVELAPFAGHLSRRGQPGGERRRRVGVFQQCTSRGP